MAITPEDSDDVGDVVVVVVVVGFEEGSVVDECAVVLDVVEKAPTSG